MQSWYCSLGLGSWLVVWGALAFGGGLSPIACCAKSALAQIVPDRTIPNNSSVTTNDNISNISGGTQAGSNLFHSFEQFSVPTGSIANFNNALDIQNIISRVTGSSISNIDGLIKANGTANLFLLNPNGIIFGSNAQLNIGGSFVGTTANAIQFGNQGFFSASSPEASSPLLTVNPSALLFNQIAAASIQNNSVAPSGLDPSGTLTATGLRVRDGQSLFLVGGNVSMDGGGLFAFGGRVELGGLLGAGTVGLNWDDQNLSLGFPDGVVRSDVSLTNDAQVNVRADNGGSIAINARFLELADSDLLAGIADGLGSVNSKAGNIEVNAQAAVNFKDNSLIYNVVAPRATGQSGDISITTGSLSLTNGAGLSASTFGRGDAGNATITARDTVSFDGVGSDGPTRVDSIVRSGGVGNGGDISITTGSLSLTNGAQLASSTLGKGDVGNVTINARDTVSFDGVDSNGYSSGVYSNVTYQAMGKAGGINITTGSLSVTNGALLLTSTFGQGDAGSVTITARDTVTFDGVGSNGEFSGVSSSVREGAVGKGGDITITTGSLAFTNAAALAVFTQGRGDAGNVTITAQDTVSFDGVRSDLFPGGVFSTVESRAVGKGGDISITTGSLSLSNGAQLLTSTRGTGDAGNVTINAQDTVSFDGSGNRLSSGAYSSVNARAVGKGGDLRITTGSLSLSNGAQLLTSTRGTGDAGNVTINAQDRVSFNGKGRNLASSGSFSNVEVGGVGKGGEIRITTSSLSVTNTAVLTSSSLGQGAAGDIELGSSSIQLDNQAGILARTASGKGGNITLRVRDLLLLRRGSQISTSAGTAGAGGDGGNITINAPNGFIIAVLGENSDITANAFTGSGGRVQIDSFGIFGIQQRSREDLVRLLVTDDPTILNPQQLPTSDITAISQTSPTLNGVVNINTPDVDPSRGLVNFPAEPSEPELASGCQAGVDQNQSSFIITGRGGFPPNPRQVLRSNAVQVNWVTLDADAKNPTEGVQSREKNAQNANYVNQRQNEIVEAQGWVVDANGNITLVATAPTATPHSSWFNHASCP